MYGVTTHRTSNLAQVRCARRRNDTSHQTECVCTHTTAMCTQRLTGCCASYCTSRHALARTCRRTAGSEVTSLCSMQVRSRARVIKKGRVTGSQQPLITPVSTVSSGITRGFGSARYITTRSTRDGSDGGYTHSSPVSTVTDGCTVVTGPMRDGANSSICAFKPGCAYRSDTP